MPIEHRIDHERHLVIARGRGVLAPREVLEYQRTVWSSPDVDGYDELMDMRDVERIVPPSRADVMALASTSAAMDSRRRASKFAIVATTDVAFGIGRMYGAYREMEEKSTKEVGVFRTTEEAMTFLGVAAGESGV